MISSEFIAHQWPKRNSDWVVEECLAIRAADLPRRDGRPYVPYPDTPVYAVKSGACIRWYFECPVCGKLVETLYRPPGDPVDWRSGLVRLASRVR